MELIVDISESKINRTSYLLIRNIFQLVLTDFLNQIRRARYRDLVFAACSG
jgi:hypothetical protein